MAELRARITSKLARSGPPSSGTTFNGGERPNDARLRLVDDVVSEGIARGLGHLTAEDEQLSGRFVTLRGHRQINFGSCSYLGLETDLRLKNAACVAVAQYGVQFSSSRAYVSCPPYAELEHLLQALFDAPVVVAPTTTRWSATSSSTTACSPCCRRSPRPGPSAASFGTTGSTAWRRSCARSP